MFDIRKPDVFLSPKSEPRYYWSLYKLGKNSITRGVSLFSKKSAQQKCYSETIERLYLHHLPPTFSSAVGTTYSFAKKQCLYEAMERAVNHQMAVEKKIISSLSRKIFETTKLTDLYDDCRSHDIRLFLYQYHTPAHVYHITCKVELQLGGVHVNILFGSKCHVSLRKAVVGSIEEAVSRVPWARKHLKSKILSKKQSAISDEEQRVYNANTLGALKQIQKIFLNNELADITEPIDKPISLRVVEELLSGNFKQNTVCIKSRKEKLFLSYIS